MNDLFAMLGLQSWKPILSALLLPPVPLLLLMLVGARMMYWRRTVSWLVILTGATGVWLCCTSGLGYWLEHAAHKPPAPHAQERVAEIKKLAASTPQKVVVVVLGGGREAMAPEYGASNLKDISLQRLAYGVWLSKQTGAPLMFSGGVGHGDSIGTTEAEAAGRIAERDYGRPLTYSEGESRDTRENAARSIAMLKPIGITDIVLVTHGFHMPRATRAFQLEALRAEMPMRVWPAPMGLATPGEHPVMRWLPSSEGFRRVRFVLHELAGLLMGA